MVKTRRQRLTEAQQQNDNKYKELLNETTEASVDINSIWSDMNQVKEKVIKPVIVAAPKTEAGGKTIKIKRQYEYAGETVVEDKWVLETSAEAKAYLNSLKIEKDEEAAEPEKVAKPAVRQGPVRKRKKSSIVDNIIKGSKLAKISTLEKSRLDWANYVDSNKLNDELVHHNKDGYLNKQDFLHKVEANIDRKFKEGTNGV